MAVTPLECVTDIVQYPLATPSSRHLSESIVVFGICMRRGRQQIFRNAVPIWEALAGSLDLALSKPVLRHASCQGIGFSHAVFVL